MRRMFVSKRIGDVGRGRAISWGQAILFSFRLICREFAPSRGVQLSRFDRARLVAENSSEGGNIPASKGGALKFASVLPANGGLGPRLPLRFSGRQSGFASSCAPPPHTPAAGRKSPPIFFNLFSVVYRRRTFASEDLSFYSPRLRCQYNCPLSLRRRSLLNVYYVTRASRYKDVEKLQQEGSPPHCPFSGSRYPHRCRAQAGRQHDPRYLVGSCQVCHVGYETAAIY